MDLCSDQELGKGSRHIPGNWLEIKKKETEIKKLDKLEGGNLKKVKKVSIFNWNKSN